MVVSELANDIERRTHKGPCSAVLFFIHVTESGARDHSQTLSTSVRLWRRMQVRERRVGARVRGDSGICYKERKSIIQPQGTSCNLALTERQVPMRSVPTL
jgi:hypothetical protein